MLALPWAAPLLFPNSLPSSCRNLASTCLQWHHQACKTQNVNCLWNNLNINSPNMLTFARPSIPTIGSGYSPRASDRMDKADLAARARAILPLNFGGACPTSDAWYIIPYLGVGCFVFNALNSACKELKSFSTYPQKASNAVKLQLKNTHKQAERQLQRYGRGYYWLNYVHTFSAPRIWTVLAGYLARVTRLPACAIRRAPTSSPTTIVKFGAIAFIRLCKYS